MESARLQFTRPTEATAHPGHHRSREIITELNKASHYSPARNDEFHQSRVPLSPIGSSVWRASCEKATIAQQSTGLTSFADLYERAVTNVLNIRPALLCHEISSSSLLTIGPSSRATDDGVNPVRGNNPHANNLVPRPSTSNGQSNTANFQDMRCDSSREASLRTKYTASLIPRPVEQVTKLGRIGTSRSDPSLAALPSWERVRRALDADSARLSDQVRFSNDEDRNGRARSASPVCNTANERTNRIGSIVNSPGSEEDSRSSGAITKKRLSTNEDTSVIPAGDPTAMTTARTGITGYKLRARGGNGSNSSKTGSRKHSKVKHRHRRMILRTFNPSNPQECFLSHVGLLKRHALVPFNKEIAN